jgi:hypothetical protein
MRTNGRWIWGSLFVFKFTSATECNGFSPNPSRLPGHGRSGTAWVIRQVSCMTDRGRRQHSLADIRQASCMIDRARWINAHTPGISDPSRSLADCHQKSRLLVPESLTIISGAFIPVRQVGWPRLKFRARLAAKRVLGHVTCRTAVTPRVSGPLHLVSNFYNDTSHNILNCKVTLPKGPQICWPWAELHPALRNAFSGECDL